MKTRFHWWIWVCAVLGFGAIPGHALAGSLVAWGGNASGQLDVPPADRETLVAVAAGHYHSLGLRSNGTVVGWGGEASDYAGASDVPAGLRDVKAIAAGMAVSMALRMDGTVVAWGPHRLPPPTPPEELGPVRAIAAGRYHALAVLEGGQVVAWGQNGSGQSDVPDDLADTTSVAGGGWHSLALRRDGTVVAWGLNSHGQTDVPVGLTDAVAISAGLNHSLALRADGTVVSWGWNEGDIMTPPEDLGWCHGISAGDWHNLAVRHDGTLVAWGRNAGGEGEIPDGLGPELALSAGGHHNLLLVGPRPQVHLLRGGEQWAYFDGDHLPDPAWYDPAYDDSGWASGPAQLGYGDGDEATRISYGSDPSQKHVTAYFRHAFTVDHPEPIQLLRLYVLRDDGAVVYLNGVEVVRENLPPGPVEFGTRAVQAMGGSDEGTFFGFNIQPCLLAAGRNVLAAEVHQASPASGDLSFDLFLGGQLGEPVIPSTPGERGHLLREVYRDIPGAQVEDLVEHQKFPDHPDDVGTVNAFEAPANVGDNYGQRLSGWILPPVAGEYVFYLASDDQSILFLSTDEDPAHKVEIAREPLWSAPRAWTGFPARPDAENVSDPIYLEAGRPYYVEALMKEGGGGDHLAVAWQAAGDPVPANGSPPVPGEFLATFPYVPENLPPSVTILSPADGEVFPRENGVPILVETVDPDGYASYVELFADGAKIGEVELVFIRAPFPGEPIHMEFLWDDPQAGEFVLTARARDDRGMFGESSPVSVEVIEELLLDPELHVVSVYSGTAPGGGTSHEHERGYASVVVDRPGRAVTLALSAYEPVEWHVTALDGTFIERVYVSGYYQPTIEGLDPGTEVIVTSHQQGSRDYFWMGYAVDSGQFYRSAPGLRSLTGLEISSFHGDYQAIHPVPYVIDEVQDDPRLQSDYPQPVPPEELPDLAWSLAFCEPGRLSPGTPVFFGQYTLQGPQNGMTILPGMRVVPDSGQRYYYGTEGHKIWRIDSETAQAVTLTLDPNVPELSWPMGMAYDGLRDRLLLVSLGGQGYLYAYDPSGQNWSVVSGMDGRDLVCLAHHPADDSLYGVSSISPDGGNPTLYRLSADGDYLGELPLPFLPFGTGPGEYRTELVPVGDYLVMLWGPGRHIRPDQEWQTARMYLIDPNSGETWLTYRQIHTPPLVQLTWLNPAPIVYGTPLTGHQLNATANVPGTYIYKPPPGTGTILQAGEHELMVYFTPADPGIDVVASASVQLEVQPAPLTIWADDQVRTEGAANPPLTATLDGLVAGDGPEDLDTAATLTTVAGPDSPPGIYPIVASGASDPNYSITHLDGTLTVVAGSFVQRDLPDVYQPGEPFVVRLEITPSPDVDSFALEDHPPLGWDVSNINDDGVFDPLMGKVKFGPYFGSDPRVVTYTVTPPENAEGVQEFEGAASADGSLVHIGGDDRVRPAPRHHPADNAPRDGKLSVNEVTAYGAAWRHGDPWPLPPNPIPIDYVTRAARLWRGGEFYTLDASAGPPPMCWVNTLSAAARPMHDPSWTAVRHVPAMFAPGDTLRVDVDIAPPAGTAGYAVELVCPADCHVAAINESGRWDATSRTVRWGPFLDSATRQLGFDVVPESTAKPRLEFSGVASFDGHSVALAGESDSVLRARLTGKIRTEADRVYLGVQGGPGARYRAEASTDLRHWIPLGETTDLGGEIEFTDPDGLAQPQRFYRVIPTGD